MRAPASAADTLTVDVIAEWSGKRPDELSFARLASGKPYVAGGPPFNVSHSGDWVAVAVASSGEVGVDVERIRPVKSRVAKRVFGTTDLSDAEFTRWWTIAEACVKADGRGVGLLREGGFGPVGDADTGTWRGYRWWSGQVEGASWAVALSDPGAGEPDVRVL